MNRSAVGAKYVAAIVVGIVGVGAFAGVSHDGRGADDPDDPEPAVEAPLPSSSVTTTVAPLTSSSMPTQSARQAPSTESAQPAPPESEPRVRLRSHGS
jgi:hypothetical protein